MGVVEDEEDGHRDPDDLNCEAEPLAHLPTEYPVLGDVTDKFPEALGESVPRPAQRQNGFHGDPYDKDGCGKRHEGCRFVDGTQCQERKERRDVCLQVLRGLSVREAPDLAGLEQRGEHDPCASRNDGREFEALRNPEPFPRQASGQREADIADQYAADVPGEIWASSDSEVPDFPPSLVDAGV